MWCIAASFLLCQCEKNDKTSITDRESNTQILASFYSFKNIVVISKPAAKKLKKKEEILFVLRGKDIFFLRKKQNKKGRMIGRICTCFLLR
jgi:cupin superfamily acireductone dioxygenase involved in methionine salvage